VQDYQEHQQDSQIHKLQHYFTYLIVN